MQQTLNPADLAIKPECKLVVYCTHLLLALFLPATCIVFWLMDEGPLGGEPNQNGNEFQFSKVL
jgi:hypothetical protein